MKSRATKNFHLPLSEALYTELRQEAERSNIPATTLARRALEEWLGQKRRADLRRAIAAYAAGRAGSEADLDESLERAGVEVLLASEASE